MSGFDFKDLLNLYIPYTFEEQLEKFANKEGKHVFDFRMKETTSEVGVKGAASYMFEGVPLVKISPNENLEIYENVIPKSYPIYLTDSKNKRRGDTIPHPSKHDLDYFTIKLDYMLSHNLSKLPTLPEQSEPASRFYMKTLSVFGYYLIVKNGRISDWSKALRYSLESHFIKNSMKGSFEENIKKISPQELFGDYADQEGVKGKFFSLEINLEDAKTRRSTPLDVLKIKSLEKDTVLNIQQNPEIGERLNGIVVLQSNSKSLVCPSFKITGPSPLKYLKEGGGKVITETKANALPDGVTLDRSRYFNEGLIRGKGPADLSLIIEFPPSSVHRVVQVNSTGSWDLRIPPEVPYKTWKETEQIKISLAEKSSENSDLESSQTTIIEPTVVKTLGIPTLGVSEGSNLLSDNKPTFDRGFSKFSELGFSETVLLTSEFLETYRYLYFNLKVGPKYLNKSQYFIGGSSGIIKDLAITTFLSARVEDGKITEKTETSDVSAQIVSNVLLETAPREKRYLFPGYSLLWRSHRTVSNKLQYKTRFNRNYEPNSLSYTLRYKLNTKKVVKTLRYRTRWDSRSYRVKNLRYISRYSLGLSGKRFLRSFYVFEWKRSSQITQSFRYSSKWRSTLSRTKNFEFKVNWKTTPIEPVIVKPFYVKTQDPQTRVWTEKISFQVYGNPKIIQDYIADNNLWFYFSNPDKFEIIKFNYNMLPYANIFLEELKDPSLEELEGIPDNYHLIGNYTISGINNINSVSLDVVGGTTQLNEAKSFWIPLDINDWDLSEFSRFSDKSLTYVHKLDGRFRDDHHEDVVELDLIILNDEECCFTQKSSGSRCSPY